MILFLIVVILLIGGTTAAMAEPVSTAIGLTAAISSFFGISAAAAGLIGGALVSTALSFGLSLAASLLQPSRGDAFDTQNVNSSQSRFTERQSTPAKRVVLGSAFEGGAAALEEFNAPYFYMLLLINWGEIAGVDRIWAGNNELMFSSITPGTALTPQAVDGQPSYSTRLQVAVRQGADDQVIDPILSAGLTSLASTFRQRGIATVCFRCHIGSDSDEYVALYGNVPRPNFYVLVRGVKAYDPREATQDIDDESTWAWTNNASLLQVYYVTRNWGGRIPMSMIDWGKVAEAADYDDELIGCADGTFIRRHTVDGVVKLDQRPYDVMVALLSANRGLLLQAGGKVWVTSSKPRTPIATIHDKVLAGGIEYRDAKPKRDLINRCQCRFVAFEQDYQTVDGPILLRSDLVAADGEVLQGTLDLPFTLDHRRAQRLQKAFLETSRLGKTLTLRVDVTWLADLSDEPVGNVIAFYSEDLFAVANGTYLCTSSGFADDFTTIELALTEYDPDIERDWIASRDEQLFTVADLDLS